MKKIGSSSATTVPGSTALPFVISTGAPQERSGEISGCSSLTFAADHNRSTLCHLERSSAGAQWRDLRLLFPNLRRGPQPLRPLSSRRSSAGAQWRDLRLLFPNIRRGPQPLPPLSSRPELRRSAVERSAVALP